MPQTKTVKQPIVFYLMSVATIWERFGFYIINFLLVLYLTKVFGLSDSKAFTLFGAFTALCYLTPPLGGYLADNLSGIKRCMLLGMLLEAIGFTLIALPQTVYFYAALGCIIVGSGLFKTCPINILARSYKEEDPRIDSGFTLFYIGINIGAFLASIIAGIMQYYIGWHMAFLSAAIALYIGFVIMLIFNSLMNRYESKPGKSSLPLYKWVGIILGSIALCIIFATLSVYAIITDIAFVVAALLLLLYLIYEITKSTPQEKRNIIACVILMLVGVVFYIFYFQAFMSISLFIDRNVIHTVFNFYVPTPTFLALDSLWMFILGPILAIAYKQLSYNNKDLAITTKFPLGILCIGLCFLILFVSTKFANNQAQVAGMWIILIFFLFALGELLLSALGDAMVARIAPKRIYGVMMGAWYLIAWGMGAALASFFAGSANIPKTIHNTHTILHIYSKAFLHLGIMGLIAAIAAFIVCGYVKRLQGKPVNAAN